MSDGLRADPQEDTEADPTVKLSESAPDGGLEGLRNVAAAAWGYRVAYEGYWSAGVPDSGLSVQTKQRLLAALVGWQQELDEALGALDDDPGDFASAKAAHRTTIEEYIRGAEAEGRAPHPSPGAVLVGDRRGQAGSGDDGNRRPSGGES